MNPILKYKFLTVSYDLHAISSVVLNTWMVDFFNTLKSNYTRNLKNKEDLKFIAIITQILFLDKTIISLGNRQAIDLTSGENVDYIKYVIVKYNLISNNYEGKHPTKIIFNFTYITSEDHIRMREMDIINNDVFLENNLDFPLTTTLNCQIVNDFIIW